MESPKSRRLAHPIETITIERRDVIARIESDPMGDEPMLRVAYKAASDYLAENASAEPISLEWEYGGGTFSAGYAPK